MTDISKLKAEAESARQNLIDALGVKINPSRIADNIIAAASKQVFLQIALQAAEKKAEARKYEEDRRNAELMMLHMSKSVIMPQFIVEQCRRIPDLPAPIADDGTNKPQFDREQDILARCAIRPYWHSYSTQSGKERGWLDKVGGRGMPYKPRLCEI